MKILIINGPNINMLGLREPDIYGTTTYEGLCGMIRDFAHDNSLEAEIYQSNHEGAIVDRIQEAYFDGTEAVVINPGAYTHYSYAIRDALAILKVPIVEVHITDVSARESFRHVSVVSDVCCGLVKGEGPSGYISALNMILSCTYKK